MDGTRGIEGGALRLLALQNSWLLCTRVCTLMTIRLRPCGQQQLPHCPTLDGTGTVAPRGDSVQAHCVQDTLPS